MDVQVREVQAEVRLNLPDNAPRIRSMGRTRKPYGLRITYGRRGDIDRVDLVVEYQFEAQRWLPADPLPAWVAALIREHRPADVTSPSANRRPGMGGLIL